MNYTQKIKSRTEEYRLDNMLHRTDGPAWICRVEEKTHTGYYIRGTDFNLLMSNIKFSKDKNTVFVESIRKLKANKEVMQDLLELICNVFKKQINPKIMENVKASIELVHDE